ncbi:hypothetical protein CTI12_AA600130 [Artemisia annua]|uniref:Uncharacterized protein n=1 Tax=Artemisia annua TaxID=35608 RepID=A0A2U1KID7_ARTAN|nr:hypothetical protein CTI12_AA600130 [Artemisia annua]
MNSEVRASNGVSNGKPPTRLQKQAPATLKLDETSNEPLGFSKGVIPLLSPLVLSPAALPAYSFSTPNNNNHEIKMNHGVAFGIMPQAQQRSDGGTSSDSRWQHPATEGTNTSSLHACFNSQCTLRPG